MSKPGARLAPSDEETGSWLGGRPRVAAGFAWPKRGGKPLGFLGQVDLADVARVCDFDWLPSSGSLAFFYDAAESPWGYDPAHAGAWHVEYVDGESAPLDAPDDMAPEGSFPRRAVAPRRVLLPPDWGPALVALGLTDRELDLLGEHEASLFDHRPQHHLGGFASPIQGNEMELECQLASNGQYVGDPSGFETPRAKQLAPGASEWRLLLQLDSDVELNMGWCDGGRLYFWVRAEEARRGDFRGVWMILQCT